MRVLLLTVTDAACMAAVWAFTVWAYRAVGLGHYKFGAEFYLHLWPASLAFLALNAMFRLYHGNLLYPAAPVSPSAPFTTVTSPLPRYRASSTLRFCCSSASDRTRSYSLTE